MSQVFSKYSTLLQNMQTTTLGGLRDFEHIDV